MNASTTIPLCEAAIGLSLSPENCAPPRTWPHMVPTRSPALTLMTVDDTGEWKPLLQAKLPSLTFRMGLFELGVRMPTSSPWSCWKVLVCCRS
jgi:hypothetical protein